MHFKKMAKSLIVAGALGLLVGMFMDTTVTTGQGWQVHNLGLQARQQKILILSGILFIAGIVLFSTAKLKATKEDEQAEEEAKERSRTARREAIEQATDLARENAGHAAGFLKHHYQEGLERNPQDLHARVQRGTYRALPVKRRFIPKPDGKQCPLGIASLEGNYSAS